jgi:protein-S-isoprenylcysteine O-methyltransferase Ste14
MSKKSLLLVIIQFLCFAFFAFSGVLAINSWLFYLQLIGFAIAVWGVLIMKFGNFNVQPEVKATAKMITKGPYKVIRNPMYTGLLIFFGIAVITNFTYLRLLFFILLAISLILKIFMEESFLEERFGKVYLDYKAKTYRLLPFLF